MANVNKVILIGNLTRDPELKMLPSQTAVVDFGLAVNRHWTGQDGVKKEETTFVDCSAFGKQAETINKYVKKGDPFYLEGRLKLDQWEAQDGGKRSKMRVVVENFQFLSRGPGGGGAGGAQGGEYSGEPGQGYAARQPAAARPAYNRGSRPGAGAVPQSAPQQSAPDYDAGDTIPEDTTPPIRDEEIPF